MLHIQLFILKLYFLYANMIYLCYYSILFFIFRMLKIQNSNAVSPISIDHL